MEEGRGKGKGATVGSGTSIKVLVGLQKGGASLCPL